MSICFAFTSIFHSQDTVSRLKLKTNQNINQNIWRKTNRTKGKYCSVASSGFQFCDQLIAYQIEPTDSNGVATGIDFTSGSQRVKLREIRYLLLFSKEGFLSVLISGNVLFNSKLVETENEKL